MNLIQFFSLNAPGGPNTPWGNLAIAVLDTLRVIICIFAFMILGLTPSTIKRANTVGQRSRLLGAGLYAIVAVLTEYNHIGDYANWRLVVNLVATACIAWGYWSAIFWETGSTYSVNTDRGIPG